MSLCVKQMLRNDDSGRWKQWKVWFGSDLSFSPLGPLSWEVGQICSSAGHLSLRRAESDTVCAEKNTGSVCYEKSAFEVQSRTPRLMWQLNQSFVPTFSSRGCEILSFCWYGAHIHNVHQSLHACRAALITVRVIFFQTKFLQSHRGLHAPVFRRTKCSK